MTNETKHTPGPWKAVRNEVHVGGRRICAYVTSGASLGIGPDLERSYANARLIAAAPELLESLIDWFFVMEDKVNTEDPAGAWAKKLEKARAAISKATGISE